MKTILVKIAAFLALLIALQAIIAYSTMPGTIKEAKKCLKENTDVVYFGDSVLDFWLETDDDWGSIVTMLQKISRGYSAGGIYHAAYNMDIYYSFAKYIKETGGKPKVLVIPINMATFSADWMKPHFQFDLERSILEYNNVFYDIFYRPISIFRKQAVSNADYMDTDVYDMDKIAGKVREFDNSSYSAYSDENFRKKIIFRYMYRLDENQQKVKSLKKMLELYRDKKTKLVFYITPVDYQVCSKKIGPDFIKNMDHNRVFLKNMITASGASFIDMAYALPSNVFAWKNHSMYINEHVNANGKRFIAKSIDKEIRKVLKIRD